MDRLHIICVHEAIVSTIRKFLFSRHVLRKQNYEECSEWNGVMNAPISRDSYPKERNYKYLLSRAHVCMCISFSNFLFDFLSSTAALFFSLGVFPLFCHFFVFTSFPCRAGLCRRFELCQNLSEWGVGSASFLMQAPPGVQAAQEEAFMIHMTLLATAFKLK